MEIKLKIKTFFYKTSIHAIRKRAHKHTCRYSFTSQAWRVVLFIYVYNAAYVHGRDLRLLFPRMLMILHILG
jgi:hypothetical protein